MPKEDGSSIIILPLSIESGENDSSIITLPLSSLLFSKDGTRYAFISSKP